MLLLTGGLLADLYGRAMRRPSDPPSAIPGLRNRPLSDMTIAKALKTAGYADCTVHGFRSSFRDWAAEMTGFAGDVVEAALAHTNRNRVEAAYRRTNYLDKRRALMDAWGEYVRAMEAAAAPRGLTSVPRAG